MNPDYFSRLKIIFATQTLAVRARITLEEGTHAAWLYYMGKFLS
jgi:hypothetical protein